ncbi:hypothetical protein K492DRAFT_164706, partial [Lichtheimia hyalospora FSU 10163]
MEHRHCFQLATFSRFTYCDYCSGFIWGLKSQGLQCKECGYACHYGCKNKAISTNRAIHDDTKTPAERALLNIQSDNPPNRTKKRHDNDDRADARREISTTDLIKDLMIAASNEANEKAAKQMPVSEYLEHQSPLNPQTTAKNFSRFIGRCGPVFALRDSIILLISWENPLNTWIAIVVYCLVCIYPKLVFVVPQLVTSFLLRRGSLKEDNDLDTIINDPPGSGSSSTGGSVFTNALNMGIPLLAMSGNASPEYRKNLQNIQNTMGEFADVHDMLVNHVQHWSQSDASMAQLRRLMVASAIITFMLVSVIPLNYIMLSAGLAVFFANTRFAKALMHLIQQDRRFFNKIISALNASQLVIPSTPDIIESDSTTTTRLVSLFENQRSYDGGKHFLEPWDKRSTWSNLSGSLSFPSPCKLQPPQGFQWQEDSEWVVDKDGPWQESYLGIEVMVHPGDDGWV